MLEGLAEIEALGYRRLKELGAPELASVRTVGGGAGNAAWTRIRQRWIDAPFLPAASQEASVGVARLARKEPDLTETPRKTRFLAFAEAFDAVFFDQYGVLHDGRRLYPGVIETLAALKARGVRVAVLSNSGKSGEANARRLERIGVACDLYDRFVTSGDVARELLGQRRARRSPCRPEARCLIIRPTARTRSPRTSDCARPTTPPKRTWW